MKLVRINNILLVLPVLLAISSPSSFLAHAQEATTAATPSLRGAPNEKDDIATTSPKQVEVSPTAAVVSPTVESVPPLEPVKAEGEGGIEIPGDKDGDKQQGRFDWNNPGKDKGNPGHW